MVKGARKKRVLINDSWDPKLVAELGRIELAFIRAGEVERLAFREEWATKTAEPHKPLHPSRFAGVRR